MAFTGKVLSLTLKLIFHFFVGFPYLHLILSYYINCFSFKEIFFYTTNIFGKPYTIFYFILYLWFSMKINSYTFGTEIAYNIIFREKKGDSEDKKIKL